MTEDEPARSSDRAPDAEAGEAAPGTGTDGVVSEVDEHLADDPTLGKVMKPLVDIENNLGQGAIAGLVFLLGFFIFALCAPPISG